MTNKEKFLALVKEQDNSVLDKIKWRIDNREWLKHSQSIALKILMRIDELNITQKELAERMGVSAQMVNKLVKGSENITLETISKLEKALGIELIYISETIQVVLSEFQIVKALNYKDIYYTIEMKKEHSGGKVIAFESTYSIWKNQFEKVS